MMALLEHPKIQPLWDAHQADAVVAVVLGDGFAKVAVKRVQNSDDIQVFVYRGDDVVQQVRTTLEELDIVSPHCLLLCPRREVMVNQLSLSAQSPNELRQMAELRIPLLSPVKTDAVLWDLYVKAESPERIDADVMMVQEVVVQKMVDQLVDAGISVAGVVLDVEAWVAGIQAAEGPLLPDCWVGIDVDVQDVHLTIVQNERLIFSRALSYESEKTDLVNEVQRMMVGCEREGLVFVPACLVLSGVLDDMPDLGDQLNEAFEQPVKFVEARVQGDCEDVSVMDVVGALTLGQTAQVNVTPLVVQQAESTQALWQIGKKTVMLLAVLIILMGGFGFLKILEREAEIQVLRSEIATLAPQTRELYGLQNTLHVLQRYQNPNASALDVLVEISKALPANVYLDDFVFAAESEVRLSGSAPAMSDVFQKLVPILKKVDAFTQVTVKSASKSRDNDRVAFQIEAALRGDIQ